MRPKNNSQPTRKPAYFLASMALHLFLGGLLIYFYISLQDQSGKQEGALEPSAAATDKEVSIASQPPLPGSQGKLALPNASAPARQENTGEGIEESTAFGRDIRSKIPRPVTPIQGAGVANRPHEEIKSPSKKNTLEFLSKRSLESNASRPKRSSPTPAARLKSAKKDESLVAIEPIVAEGSITRAQFTTGIKQREPTDQVGPVVLAKNKGIKQLYYFTEIKGMKGEAITHRWEHEGQVIAKVQLHIGSNLWRTYSRKNLTPSMVGDWRVVVTDAQGHPIYTGHFVYVTTPVGEAKGVSKD